MSCGCNSISLGGGGSDNDSALLTTIERFSADRFSPSGRFFVHDLKRDWEAIAIGPRSMFDRCYVIPGQQLDYPVPRTTLTQFYLSEYSGQALEVSVERPHIGHVRGPIIVAPPYSQSVVPTTTNRVSGMIDSNVSSRIGSLGIDSITPYLDLMFYRRVPSFIATKRAPWEYVSLLSSFGTGSGATSATINLPGWGRQHWHIAINFTIPSGSIDYRIVGIDRYSIISANVSDIETTLVPLTTITATGPVSHVITEEFDVIQVVFQENAALGANSAVEIVARGRD